MRSLRFKKLTLSLFVGYALTASLYVHAKIFSQENLKTHLRWNFSSNKEQILITKQPQVLKLETLDIDLYEKLIQELSNESLNPEYFNRISYSKDNFPTKPAAIEIKLQDEAVEMFSFYKDNDKKYVLDFWINTDLITARNAAIKKADDMVKTAPVANPDVTDTTIQRPKQLPKLAQSDVKKLQAAGTAFANKVNQSPEAKLFRDFRYGGALIWDYKGMTPTPEKIINLESKTPDSLYPISDREFEKDDKEAHMQLTINLYNKEKWGLMNKSISLYNQKYGNDKNFELNEFIKANALLKNNLREKNKSITNSAINILKNLAEKTKNYELKSAIYKYMIDYNQSLKELIQTLNLGKKLYVESKANFDNETALYAANIILNTLAQLGQDEQIEQFISDASVKKLIPAQLGFAHKSYVLLNKDQTEDLIKEFEKSEKSLARPIHPALLFNVAESYFRTAQYEKSVKVLDDFIKDYSYTDKSSEARLRLALIYDLLNKNTEEVLNLYKNAINRSVTPAIRYEAKVRYVGVRINRKYKLDDADKETLVFLEQSSDEKDVLSGDLKKLLWLVRLRSFISTKFYQEALTYLLSLPLDSMKPAERRLFEGDGAEVIFGLIKENYSREQYSKAVKIWETYKEKYSDKVGLNPEINFIISHSYIKLGLYSSYERTFDKFKEMKATEVQSYPLWIERNAKLSIPHLLAELSILKFINVKDWSSVDSKVNELLSTDANNTRYIYYKGLASFNLKKYREAAQNIEKLLIEQDGGKILNHIELSNITTAYLESLYNVGEDERFKTAAKAIIEDLSRSDNPLVQQSLERVSYLLIESLAGEKKTDYIELESQIKNFKNRFKTSQYSGRINYLHGTSLIRTDKLDEGEKVLRDLIKDQKVPGYIRELSKAELSSLEIRRKSL